MLSIVSPRILLGLLLFALAATWPLTAFAQNADAPEDAAEGDAVATRGAAPDTSPRTDGKGRFRQLADGVMLTIDPETQVVESFARHDLLDMLGKSETFGERAWATNRCRQVRFPPLPDGFQLKDPLPQRDIWALEFSFKPCRYVWVDVPTPEGRFVRKNVWYICYNVRNLGDKPVRFIPRFLLHSWDTNKFYPDRLVPLAERPIQQREDPNRRLLNSVEMSDQEIPPSEEGDEHKVWGCVCWEDVEPKTDRFSIYIQGLTNACYWIESEDKAGERRYYRKTLQLNFWRPGDDRFEDEQEIRFGMPQGSLSAAELVAARKNAGWTQEECAEKVGVSAEMMARWEDGEAVVPSKLAPKVQEVLGEHMEPLVDYRWVYK